MKFFMSRSRLLPAVLLILILTWGCRETPSNSSRVKPDGVRLLKEWLRKDVKIQESLQGNAIAYCPDNTCEEFSATRNVNLEILADFVILYLFYVSDYVYLSEDRERQEGTLIPRILSEHSTGCESKIERQLISCVLISLAKEYGIRSAFIKYDEDTRTEVPIDLSQQLKRLQ